MFLKSQITEINPNISQNASEIYKFVNCCNFGEENWKKIHEIGSCHGNIKSDGHKIDISKFLCRTNEQLLKVSAL